jgi:hypothetical protein
MINRSTSVKAEDMMRAWFTCSIIGFIIAYTALTFFECITIASTFVLCPWFQEGLGVLLETPITTTQSIIFY